MQHRRRRRLLAAMEGGGWLLAALAACATVLLASTTAPGSALARTAAETAAAAAPAWMGMSAATEQSEEDDDGDDAFSIEEQAMQEEQMEVLRTITEHCLPKLVCELYSKQHKSSLTEHEISLMQLIGVTALNPSGPSKYHFAAHMGQLIRGVEGTGCHEFYPSCPFSGDDVRHIARKIQVR